MLEWDCAAVMGAYAPTILYGSSRWRPGIDSDRRTPQDLPSYALLGVEEGAHRIELGRQVWRLGPGAVCLLAPQQQFIHQVADGARLLYLVFNVMASKLYRIDGQSVLRREEDDLPQPAPEVIWGQSLPVTMPAELASRLFPGLAAMCDLWWRGGRSRFRANHLLADFLHTVVLHETDSPTEQAPIDDPIALAMTRVRQRRLPKSVSEWAELVQLSERQFSRLFKASRDETPGFWLRQARLKRAEELLVQTRYTIDHIAHEAGYRNVSAFDHAFHAKHACSPTVWRRRYAR